MNERAALLRAICEQPDDDTVRLAFADWLEEHGEAERGEFIRLQMELVHLRASGYHCYHDLTQPEHCEMCVRQKRAKELAIADAGGRCQWEVWHGLPDDVGWACLNLTGEPPERLRGQGNWFRFDRGFPSEIRLSQASFLKHARDIFAAQPVTAVTLSDREPYPASMKPEWFWIHSNESRDEPTTIAEPLWRRSRLSGLNGRHHRAKSFNTPGAAREALSAECVNHGRALADLPPLTAVSSASS